MPKVVEVEIKGLSELQDKLEKMPDKMANRVLRQALTKAGFLMKLAMARLAPKDTSFLAEHFDVKGRVKRKGIEGSVFIGPNGKIDYPKNGTYRKLLNRHGKEYSSGRIPVVAVAGFLEFGTAKMSKRPFMTQAFDATKEQCLNLIIEGIREGIKDAEGK